MKKWLFGCLLTLGLMLCVGSAMADGTIKCKVCNEWTTTKSAGVKYYDRNYHREINECTKCHTQYDGQALPHSGGERDCYNGKICTECKGEYTGPLGHDLQFTNIGKGRHSRVCKRAGCDYNTPVRCFGGTATCTDKAVCMECGVAYGNTLGHEWGEWKSNGNGTHTRVCGRDGSHTQTESCTGGEATCIAKAVCDVCGTEYGQIDSNNHDIISHDGKAPTCTEIGWDAYVTCKREGCGYTNYQDLPALQHDLERHEAKAATCTEIGWDAYVTCKREGCDYTTYQDLPTLEHDLEGHEAKAATCTEIGWDAYVTCKRDGCNYTTYKQLDMLNHDYAGTVIRPSCGKAGYTVFACRRCRDVYIADGTPAYSHWYGEWTGNGDGTHDASCRREDCAHTGRADCQRFEFTTAADGKMLFCPVCGEVEGGARLELIENALAAAVTGRLPAGEATARMNHEYLSVAFEHAGWLTQPTGQVRITLPAELLSGRTLALAAQDGTETELPFETDGEEISFILDFTGAEICVMLIRLVPAA